MKPLVLPSLVFLGLSLGSCISVKTEHEVKPIEINVNVRVKVEKELDDFFGDLDSQTADLSE